MPDGIEFQRGKWEGCIEQKMKDVAKTGDAMAVSILDIYRRLSAIDRKVAAMSPLMRIFEAGVVAAVAAGIATVVK